MAYRHSVANRQLQPRPPGQSCNCRQPQGLRMQSAGSQSPPSWLALGGLWTSCFPLQSLASGPLCTPPFPHEDGTTQQCLPTIGLLMTVPGSEHHLRDFAGYCSADAPNHLSNE